MSDYRTDEETIELVKRWWRENGVSLLIGIAVMLTAVLGFRAWQDHARQQNELAAQRFREFENTQGATAEGVAQTRAFLYKQIKQEHAKTGYAAMAAMLEAQRLAAHNEFAAAVKELTWAIDVAPSPHLRDVIRLRLARAQWAQGDAEQALKTLAQIDTAGFSSEIEELRGDVLFARGDRAGAYAAYQKAIAAAGKARSALLDVKRDDAAPLAAAPPASAAAPVANAAPAAGVATTATGHAP